MLISSKYLLSLTRSVGSEFVRQSSTVGDTGDPGFGLTNSGPPTGAVGDVAFHLDVVGKKGLEYLADIDGGTRWNDLLRERDRIGETVKVARLEEWFLERLDHTEIFHMCRERDEHGLRDRLCGGCGRNDCNWLLNGG